MIALTIKVRYCAGAYVTSTINKKRASCTSSAEAAARNLADKLFGASVQRVEEVERQPDDPVGVSWWRVVLAETGMESSPECQP
ncbi:MAG TPA: hypothetical protein VJ576_02710 [Rhodocyclaceae bacterium]|nr:hypothetical protein [Rhodocyclaceae bacterium]